MKAAVVVANEDVQYQEVEEPQVTPGHVKIKVRYSGICGSDIPRVLNHGVHFYPIVLGHEFSGDVVEVGEGVTKVKVGDRVSGAPLLPCMKCDDCQQGNFSLCKHYSFIGSRQQGSNADYVVVPEQNAVPFDKTVPYEQGAMFEPATVAIHGVFQNDYHGGEYVAILGGGTVGMFTMQWTKIFGSKKVVVFDISDERLALAKRLGATAGVNGMKTDAVAAIKELTGGEGVDIAIEFAGNKITHVQAVASCKKNGEVVYGGITYDDVTYPNKVIQAILRGELTIHGSWNSSINPLPINEWKSGLEFMSTGQMNVNPLITHRVRLEDCKEVFEMMFNRTEVFTKVLFKPEM